METPGNPKKRVALIMAMEAEALPLVEELALKLAPDFGDSELPFRHYRGDFRGIFDILLSVSGKDARYDVDNIGTEPATLSAYVSLRQFKPHLCINAGTAGGFAKRGALIGDVFLSDRPFRFHDRRIPIPGFEAYGVGSYPARLFLEMAEKLGLKKGAVSTGNSLDFTDKCLKIMDAHETSAKEMEAAAIAWVAWMMKVPFLALKSITDIVDGPHPSEEEFLRNLEFSSRVLRAKTIEVLDYLAEHPNEL